MYFSHIFSFIIIAAKKDPADPIAFLIGLAVLVPFIILFVIFHKPPRCEICKEELTNRHNKYSGTFDGVEYKCVCTKCKNAFMGQKRKQAKSALRGRQKGGAQEEETSPCPNCSKPISNAAIFEGLRTCPYCRYNFTV